MFQTPKPDCLRDAGVADQHVSQTVVYDMRARAEAVQVPTRKAKNVSTGMKGLGDGNGITPTVFTMFFHKNDYWDSHRRTRNSPAHGTA